MDPIREELRYLLALPLGGHVPGAVDRGEVEAVVANKVAGDLSIGVPRVPVLLDGPVKHLNPSACAIGRYSTICVTRVEENLVAVLLHDLVDPE